PQELRSGRFWRGVLAELLATLIFVGVVLGASASPEQLAPALAGGLVAGGLLCTLGGPQANPALTLALLCTRKLSALRGAMGVLAQEDLGCWGGIGEQLFGVLSPLPTQLHPGVGPGQGTVVELLLTAQFILCVFASFDDRHDGRPAMAAVPVGFSLALGHLFGVR
ncbi:MIP protein, partial [Spizella passerina]|nr:MIP protein [Spizella passerina]